MYRHSEGGLQLPQHIGGVLHNFAVEIHGDNLLLNGAYHPDIAVKHSHA